MYGKYRGIIAAAACFVAQLIIEGFILSVPIVFPGIQADFELSYVEVSVVGSLLNGVWFMLCPLTNVLIERFGHRATMATAAFVAAISAEYACFARGYWSFLISLGVVAGSGLGVAYMPAVTAATFHFTGRRQHFVITSGSIGGALGITLFSFMFKGILENNPYRICITASSCAFAQLIVCGVLLLPPATESIAQVSVKASDELAQLPIMTGDIVEEFIQEKLSNLIGCASDVNQDEHRLEETSCQSENVELSNTQEEELFSPTLNDNTNIIDTETSRELEFVNQQPRLLYRLQSGMISDCPNDNLEETGETVVPSKTAVSTMRLSLFQRYPGYKLIKLIAFWVSNFLWNVGTFAFSSSLSVCLKRNNFSETEAADLYIMSSATNIVGRILSSGLAVTSFRLSIYLAASVLSGIALLPLVFSRSYLAYATACSLCGLGIGIQSAIIPSVALQLFELENVEHALSLILFACGAGGIVGPPVTGALLDAEVTLTAVFCCECIITVIGGVAILPAFKN